MECQWSKNTDQMILTQHLLNNNLEHLSSSLSSKSKNSPLFPHRKPQARPTTAAWVSRPWQAPPTCDRPSTGRPPLSPPCRPTSGLTHPPYAPSASTPGRTSCHPPTATTHSSCRSTLPTRSWLTTCPACTMPTRPCASASSARGRCASGRSGSVSCASG